MRPGAASAAPQRPATAQGAAPRPRRPCGTRQQRELICAGHGSAGAGSAPPSPACGRDGLRAAPAGRDHGVRIGVDGQGGAPRSAGLCARRPARRPGRWHRPVRSGRHWVRRHGSARMARAPVACRRSTRGAPATRCSGARAARRGRHGPAARGGLRTDRSDHGASPPGRPDHGGGPGPARRQGRRRATRRRRPRGLRVSVLQGWAALVPCRPLRGGDRTTATTAPARRRRKRVPVTAAQARVPPGAGERTLPGPACDPLTRPDPGATFHI